jgi:hypothetical protein
MLLTCLATVTFASCKKELDVEPGTEKVTFVRKPADLMLASTAPASKFSGSMLAFSINGHMGDAPYLATSPTKQIQLLKNRE